MISVTHFMRRRGPNSYSIERLYEDLRLHMSDDISIYLRESRFQSLGIWRRIFDCVAAYFYQGDVNHVTGDIHFLTYFLSKKRTVLTVHDCHILESHSGIQRWLLWFFWFWIPEKRCAAIVVISEATKHQLLKHLNCDPKKLWVIYNSASLEFSRNEKEFNVHQPRILHIGTKENKNLKRLAKALVGINCMLIVIGAMSKSQKDTLECSGIAYENSSDLTRSELLREYINCDMLAFVSTYEGFGLPIIEANAVGRAVVTSNMMSMPEVAGDAACLVDPFDVGSIRSGILKVINDVKYREHLISKGFINSERFQIKSIAGKYEELYKSIYENTHRQV